MMKIYFMLFTSWRLNKEMLSATLIFMMLAFSVNEQPFINMTSPSMMMDTPSLLLVILTVWLTNLMIMSMYKTASTALMSTFLGLMLSVNLSFQMSSPLLFYFMFEISLLPILMMILGWGYQMERMKAGLSLLFYTLFASLPLLLMIVALQTFGYLTSLFFMPLLTPAGSALFNSFSFFLLLAFMVKLPIYFFHLWLSKAHVEAPVSGSMFLAGVLLKLGGYGMLRLSPLIHLYNIKGLLSLGLWGGALLGFACLKLLDMKVLIAYSSVVHMTMIPVCLLWNSYWGVMGALVMMIAHGLCSAGMFSQANMFYVRSHSRNILLNKGLINLSSIQTIWWFLLIMANFGGPFTFNLISEIMMINTLIMISPALSVSVFLLASLSAAYSLILFSSFQQGKPLISMKMFLTHFSTEALCLFSLVWPLLFLCLSFFSM